MGIFDFLRKKQPQAIRMQDLGEWLDQQVENKALNQKVAFARNEINGIIGECREFLDALEAAQLQNDKIPVKEKQVMDGHRRIYLQKMRKFLDGLSVPDNFDQVGHFAARLSESINHLGEDTHKNQSVLKHFFEHETGAVAKGIKHISQAVSELQASIEKEGVELIKEAKIRLRQYNDDANRKARLEQELESHSSELDALRKKKEKIEATLSDLRKGPEYSEFRGIIEEKKKVEERTAELEQELITLFTDLNRPLKKHTHGTAHEKTADKYIADPAGALGEDASLAIHDLIGRMAGELDLIDLKDRQLERVKELCEKLSREFLASKRDEISSLRSQNSELAVKINRSMIALTISENESWLKSLDSKIAEWEREVERVEKEVAEINLDYLRQKAKEKAREVSKDLIIEE